MPHRHARSVALAVITAVFFSGCFLFGINSAQKLADAFRKNGITYSSATKVPVKEHKNARTGQSLKVNEALDLRGQELYVEIMRISDRHTFDAFRPVLEVSLAMFETGYKKPRGSMSAYLKYPFVVIVLDEPENGGVYAALRKIFPGEPISEVVASEEGYKFIQQLKDQLKNLLQ